MSAPYTSFRIQLINPGESILDEYKTDGLVSTTPVGRLAPGSAALKLLLDYDFLPVRVGGRREVSSAKIVSSKLAENGAVRQSVPIQESETGDCYSSSPTNTIYLVDLTQPNEMGIIEVALTSQNSLFWLTTQQTYCCPLGLPNPISTDLSGIYCPALVGWLEMLNFVAMASAARGLNLQKLALEPEFNLDPVPDDHARVIWWNMARQVGAALLPDGQSAKLHWTNLVRPASSLAYALPGELLEVEGVKAPETHKRSTSFKLEIAKATVSTAADALVNSA